MGGKSSKEKSKNKKAAADEKTDENNVENKANKEENKEATATKEEPAEKPTGETKTNKEGTKEQKTSEETGETKTNKQDTKEQKTSEETEAVKTPENKEQSKSQDQTKYDDKDIDEALATSENVTVETDTQKETSGEIPKVDDKEKTAVENSESKQTIENLDKQPNEKDIRDVTVEQSRKNSQTKHEESKTEVIKKEFSATEDNIGEKIPDSSATEMKSDVNAEVGETKHKLDTDIDSSTEQSAVDAVETKMEIKVNEHKTEEPTSPLPEPVVPKHDDSKTNEDHMQFDKQRETEPPPSVKSEGAEITEGQSTGENTGDNNTESKEMKSEEKPDESKKSIEIRWEHGGEQVQVTGSFNNWSDKLTLEKKDDVFVVSIDLSPGEYSYKFLVDDEWKINSSQEVRHDESGVENNFLVVG